MRKEGVKSFTIERVLDFEAAKVEVVNTAFRRKSVMRANYSDR